MQAGELKRRIRIEQPDTSGPDAKGGRKLKWSVVVDRVPAKIVYAPPSKKGDESLAQQQVQSGVFATMTIRFMPSVNISSAMRVVYGTRIFNIRTAFQNDEDRRFITLQCEELQAKGTLNV